MIQIIWLPENSLVTFKKMNPPQLNSTTLPKPVSEITSPPGSFLMWLIVVIEVLVFSVLFMMVAKDRSADLEAFRVESLQLNIQDGIFMTLALLGSGFLAAEGVRLFFAKERRTSFFYFLLSTLFGLGFLFLKIRDFIHKAELGLVIEKNSYWQSYWLLMGFHFFHVLVGVLILASISLRVLKDEIEDPEFSVRGGVLFWHMCDIIWLIIFPLFYFGGRSL